jgi:MbtH protein
MEPDSGSERRYVVVVNDEEQYSIWRIHLPIPAGWTTIGEPGDKETCLAYIEKNWTDMRPASLREWMRNNSTES